VPTRRAALALAQANSPSLPPPPSPPPSPPVRVDPPVHPSAVHAQHAHAQHVDEVPATVPATVPPPPPVLCFDLALSIRRRETPQVPSHTAAAKKPRVVDKYAPRLSRANCYEDDYDDDSEVRFRKVRWAQTEDLTIVAAVRRLGSRWPEIAALLPGRTGDAVRNRWHRLQMAQVLADTDEGRAVPDVMLPQISEEDAAAARLAQLTQQAAAVEEKGGAPWSAEEDAMLLDGVRRHGCRWRVIVASLPGRSDSSTRNRYKRLLCEGAAPPRAARDGALSGSSPLPPSPLRPPLSSSF